MHLGERQTDHERDFKTGKSIARQRRTGTPGSERCLRLRIQPGHPQQNGRHERMHVTLKREVTKPAAANFLQQQARFDDFLEVFNQQRPHEALGMKYPAEVYQPSLRPYQGLPDLDYPCTTKPLWSLVAAASVWAAKRSTSAKSSQARQSASKRCTTTSGWSVL
jgi:hypothetical protein